MRVCLLTRNFDPSGGIGRVSTKLRDGLVKAGHEVHTVSSPRSGLIGYFKYIFFDIRRRMPKDCDIYHAVTPMESIWIPKDRGVCTILDIIAITHPDRYGGRIGRSRILSTIGKVLFTYGCRQAARCRYVTCISEQVKEDFLTYFDVDRRKVKVIRLGIGI